MEPVLLIDFGSTYTKVTAVDREGQTLLGTAASYTTVETDINEGLEQALSALEEKTGKLDFSFRLACSSAAGGLKMVVSGLVPELTAEAAKMACLGAGAKVIKTYAYQLTDEDMAEILALKPDIFLLTGGTDGGNTQCVLHNAKMLAGAEADFPILIAGNRSCQKECAEILAEKETYRCENVMPRIGQINPQPAQEKIRELFLKKIIQAKGLSQASELISGILMPTPAAVLAAVELLAEGTETEAGIGELVAVDVGGATTDVYSIGEGAPVNDATLLKGLPEPYSKRTVEGDIGMRYSAKGILEAAGADRLSQLASLDREQVKELVEYVSRNTDSLPDTPELEALDYGLASAAVETAVARHAGVLEEVYTPLGLTLVQTGKDLGAIRQILVTGGSIIHTKQTGEIASHALRSPQNPFSLRPNEANILVDRKYILAAMGLLSQKDRECALSLMKKELVNHGYYK